MTNWIEKAKEMGFDAAVPLDPRMLHAREDVRDMCTADKCGAYNKNWTCPPACGTVAECQEKMRSFENGILLQSIGRMRKSIDSRCYRETERRHMQNFHAFAAQLRQEYPGALCLGAGGCRICKQCLSPALPVSGAGDVQHGGLRAFCYPGLQGCRIAILLRRKNHYLHRLHPVLGQDRKPATRYGGAPGNVQPYENRRCFL